MINCIADLTESIPCSSVIGVGMTGFTWICVINLGKWVGQKSVKQNVITSCSSIYIRYQSWMKSIQGCESSCGDKLLKWTNKQIEEWTTGMKETKMPFCSQKHVYARKYNNIQRYRRLKGSPNFPISPHYYHLRYHWIYVFFFDTNESKKLLPNSIPNYE